MKIRGKVLQLDVVNKNYNYVSTEVMYKIIDKLVLYETKPIRNGRGYKQAIKHIQTHTTQEERDRAMEEFKKQENI